MAPAYTNYSTVVLYSTVVARAEGHTGDLRCNT